MNEGKVSWLKVWHNTAAFVVSVTHETQAQFRCPHMISCSFHHLLSSYIYHIIMFFLQSLASFKVCEMCFVFVCFLNIDRWGCEGQPVVGVGPHPHLVWKETDEEVGEPAPHRPTVSKETSDEA